MHIIPDVGGGNTYLLTKLKKSWFSAAYLLCFLLSSPLLLFCLSFPSATKIFLVALSSLPSQASDITQTSHVFVTTVQALRVVLDLFSFLYLWTLCKVTMSVE